MNYGRALKRLREKRNLKQKDLAERSGLDAGYISQIESGKRVPSTLAIESMAKAFGVPVYLLTFFASDADDLQGISEDAARELEIRLLDLVMESEKTRG
jgi:transcriptional regulator with XRE-family HTH domain